jgi:hypothetical protein
VGWQSAPEWGNPEVGSKPSLFLRGRARGWSHYQISLGKSPLVLKRGESPGSPGALYWVHRRANLCGSLALGAFLFLLGLREFSRKSRENLTEFRSQSSGCERPYRYELQVQLQANNTDRDTG